MNRLIILLIFSLPACSVEAQDTIKHRYYLVGDAGEMQNGKHPVCDWLKNNMKGDIIYLGDNIYPQGMPDETAKSYKTAKEIIDRQVSVVKDKNTSAWFVNGNHDWKKGKKDGWEYAKNISR